MKFIHENLRKHKGFTLVEILVVIAIISTLAGISIPIGLRVYNSAKVMETEAMVKDFAVAANSYVKDYGDIVNGMSNIVNSQLTTSAGSRSSAIVNDAVVSVSDGTGFNGAENLLPALLGYDTGGAKNERKISYLKIADAVNFKSGVIRNSSGFPVGLADAWGRGLFISLDLDYDGKADDANLSSRDLAGNALLIYSTGKDHTRYTDDDISSN